MDRAGCGRSTVSVILSGREGEREGGREGGWEVGKEVVKSFACVILYTCPGLLWF